MHQTCRILKCFANFKPNTNLRDRNFFDCVLECSRSYCRVKFKEVTRKPTPYNLKTMKLDSPEFRSSITDEVRTLRDLFTNHGYDIRIVGGAVRDLLLGIQPKDLDFATTATPAEMKEMFINANVRLLNMNGEKHGTITARINDKNFEVTTLRIDLLTDGRRAEVCFTKDWVLDANRRDLTVNAMYLGFDGTLYDYFNGYEDLKNQRVVFVGNAGERIQEDYLRILRYFRFYGKIAKLPDNHEEDVIKAIQENAQGLENISGERIWSEVNKILTGRFAGEIIEKIVSLDVGPYIGLPGKGMEYHLKRIWDRLKAKDIMPKPVTLLCSLFKNEVEWENFVLRVKPSCAERDLGYFIMKNRDIKIISNPLKFYQCLALKPGSHIGFILELLKYRGEFDILEELTVWQPPQFPINGHMLKDKGVFGKNITLALNELKDIWVKNDFDISADKLLEQIPENLLNQKEEKRRRKQ